MDFLPSPNHKVFTDPYTPDHRPVLSPRLIHDLWTQVKNSTLLATNDFNEQVF